jgi:hypothetical protein
MNTLKKIGSSRVGHIVRRSARFLFVSLVAFHTSGCSLTTKHGDSNRDSESKSDSGKGTEPGQVPDDLSLKSDRSQLDDLRKEIPEEIKRTNDELALIFEILNAKGGDEEPSAVRERFDKALRSRRDKNDKDLRRRREDFSKSEKRERDLFLEKLKAEREKFVSKKVTPDERRRFFEDQDQSRRDFFADQADKRKEFESAIQDGRKTFEDYAREKQNQFSQELRAYTAGYYDRKKNVDLKKRVDAQVKEKEREKERDEEQKQMRESTIRQNSKPVEDPDEEFKQIPKSRGTTLAPADDGH